MITSYGIDRATIRSTKDVSTFYGYNVSFIEIRNINFIGIGTGSTESGIEIYGDSSFGSESIPHLYIDSVEVSGFRRGILIGAWDGESGFRDIQINHTEAYDNNHSGIFIYGQQKNSHHDVLIEDCIAYNNTGTPGNQGNGILLNGITNGLLQHCIAYNNGTKGSGGVGIWTYGADSITIQYSESYSNRTSGSADGGGFDIDGGVTNSIIQYCYSHDNDGAGYLLAQYNNATQEYGPLENNIIRYNISQNDARKNSYGGIMFWGHNANDQVGANQVYNNTVFMGGTTSYGTPSCVRFFDGSFGNKALEQFTDCR